MTTWRDDTEVKRLLRTASYLDLDTLVEAAVAARDRELASQIEAKFGQEREVLLHQSAYFPGDVKTARTTMATVRRMLMLLKQEHAR